MLVSEMRPLLQPLLYLDGLCYPIQFFQKDLKLPRNEKLHTHSRTFNRESFLIGARLTFVNTVLMTLTRPFNPLVYSRLFQTFNGILMRFDGHNSNPLI